MSTRIHEAMPIPRSFVDETPQEDDDTPWTKTACWNKEHLKTLDLTLDLHYRKSRSTILSLDSFYALARKLLAQIRTKEVAAASTSMAPICVGNDESNEKRLNNDTHSKTNKLAYPKVSEYLQNLQEEERLLYQLVAATSPQLYVLRQARRKELEPWSTDTTPVWCLKRMKVASSIRTRTLNTLLNQLTFPKNTDDATLKALEHYREQQSGKRQVQAQQNQKVASTQDTTAIAAEEPLIEPGMTVEERVWARAVVANNDKKQSRTESTVDLERVADAVFVYKRRHGTVVWSELVAAVVRSIPASSVRRVRAAILELQERFPSWIGIGNVEKKDSVVHVAAVDYGEIRRQLRFYDGASIAHVPAKKEANPLLQAGKRKTVAATASQRMARLLQSTKPTIPASKKPRKSAKILASVKAPTKARSEASLTPKLSTTIHTMSPLSTSSSKDSVVSPI